MRLTRAEVVWAGRAFMPAPGRVKVGGPDPDELQMVVHELREILAGPATTAALVPLPMLIAAVKMARATSDEVQRGGERLRALGLSNVAVGAARGQVGGEAEEILGAQPPETIVAVMDARIAAERPPVPEWLGRGRTSGEVVGEFEMPTPDMLDDMGLVALNQRLDQLEAGARDAERRRRWVEQYQYGPAALMQEREAAAMFSRLIVQARAAFARSPLPAQWGAPEIPRRVMDRLALGAPMLAAELMQRTPATVITTPDDMGDE